MIRIQPVKIICDYLTERDVNWVLGTIAFVAESNKYYERVVDGSGSGSFSEVIASSYFIKGDGTLGTVSSDSITLNAKPADHSATGVKITLVAHQTVAFGDVCYINASGEAQLIDADAIASMSGICMALASINADASGSFLLQGIARDDTWDWTVGGLIFGTITASSGNTLSQSAPSGTDDVVQILGVATHADRMYFNPQLSQVEHT